MISRLSFINICFDQALNAWQFIKLLSLNISIQVAINFTFLFTCKPLWCLQCLRVLFVKVFWLLPTFWLHQYIFNFECSYKSFLSVYTVRKVSLIFHWYTSQWGFLILDIGPTLLWSPVDPLFLFVVSESSSCLNIKCEKLLACLETVLLRLGKHRGSALLNYLFSVLRWQHD